MAEPLKHPVSSAPSGGSGEPRTARARDTRDFGGRGKRGGSTSSRQRSQRERASSKSSGGSGNANGRQRVATPRSPGRPRQVEAGSGARILAPVALAVFAIACFGVLSSSGDDSVKTTTTKASGKNGSASKTTVKTPNGPTRSVYRVKAGDSFSSIAAAQGIDAATLQELNPKVDARELQPGMKLKLKQ